MLKNKIKILLRENLSPKFEYQIRDIGGPVYYKRKTGDKIWSFTDSEDFSKNASDENTIEFIEKKPKKGPYVRQVEVPQEMDDKLEYIKIYYTNLSPNETEVSIEDNNIIIKPSLD